jgi:hypothetical protein
MQVIDALEPVLRAVSLGEYPQYETIAQAALDREAAETREVLAWLLGSAKADLRAVGLTLVGVLEVRELMPDLIKAAQSPDQWERLTAIEALARRPGEPGRETLDALRDHPDPVTAQAARAAIAVRSSPG